MITNSDAATSVRLVFEPDAEEFCQTNNLFGLVQLARDVAARHYVLAGPINVELETDPDDNDAQRPLLIAPIFATVDEACAQRNAFTREWVALVPHELSLSLCLLTHIMGPGDAT